MRKSTIKVRPIVECNDIILGNETTLHENRLINSCAAGRIIPSISACPLNHVTWITSHTVRDWCYIIRKYALKRVEIQGKSNNLWSIR